MSVPKQCNVNCPKCGNSFTTTIFESINTDFEPNLAEKIISRERFAAKCPKCGNVANLEYDVLYHDLKHNAMIWVVNKNNSNYNKRLSEIKGIKSVIKTIKITRIVCDIDALREKTACLESGKDDRIIELYKYYLSTKLMEQKPDFDFRDAFYTFFKGTDIVYFYDTTGEEIRCNIDNQIYNQIADLFADLIIETDKSSYWGVFDRIWASKAFETLQKDNLDKIDNIEINSNDTDYELKKEAEEKGLTVNQLIALREMKQKTERQQYLNQLELSKAVKEKYPEFDFDESIKNPVFSKLVNLKYDMKKVYEYVNREQLFKRRIITQEGYSNNPTADEYYAFLLEFNNSNEKIPDDYSKKSLAEIEKEAAKLGVTVEDLINRKKLLMENYKLIERINSEKYRGIAETAVATKSIYPFFDLKTEWGNDEFRKIATVLDATVAYEFLHFSDLYIEKGRKKSFEEENRGEDSSNIMFCRICGHRIPLDSVFCYKCGTKVVKE